MARVKRSVNAKKMRRTTLDRASGYRGQRSRLYRKAKEQVTHSMVYNYRGRKVRKSEFNADPGRYVLRLGFPDFPECPFGQGFTMLGFDTARQEYVWLVTKIIGDERLQRVPFQGENSEA